MKMKMRVERMPATANPSPSVASRSALRKPLYVLLRGAAMIDCQGQALALHVPEQPVRRFPVQRISRVICREQVGWKAGAVASCLAHGVTITWVGADGLSLGSAEPRQRQPSECAQLISDWLEIPHCWQRLSNWRARRRLDVLNASAQRMLDAGGMLNPMIFEQLKRSYVYREEFPLVFDRECHAWLDALVAEGLSKSGLQLCYWGHGAEVFELHKEISALLWAELNFDCGALAGAVHDSRLAAQLFEAWAPQGEFRLLYHVGDLKRYLARELARWH